MLLYPELKRTNRHIGYKYEKNIDGYNHIYSGNILTYLKKAFPKEKKDIY